MKTLLAALAALLITSPVLADDKCISPIDVSTMTSMSEVIQIPITKFAGHADDGTTVGIYQNDGTTYFLVHFDKNVCLIEKDNPILVTKSQLVEMGILADVNT